ncbi:hypothetical protein TWF694_009927 [Orbilia ellipsospora]|uniref:Uncharacterized protein n=1 Tax=Orbilia ellipsospora TaxID=2528407 RepID=A0AAV9XDH7_9PEZI
MCPVAACTCCFLTRVAQRDHQITAQIVLDVNGATFLLMVPFRGSMDGSNKNPPNLTAPSLPPSINQPSSLVLTLQQQQRPSHQPIRHLQNSSFIHQPSNYRQIFSRSLKLHRPGIDRYTHPPPYSPHPISQNLSGTRETSLS